MSSSIDRMGLFYVNGILNDFMDDKKTEESINKFKKIVGTRKHVDFKHIHNQAYDQNQAAISILNVLEAVWKQSTESILKPLVSSCSQAYQEIQQKKIIPARQVRDEVKSYLDQEVSRKAILIFHSQGAHVGFLALQDLDQAYRQRIHIISLAGMIHIPSSIAHTVINIDNEVDPIYYPRNYLFHPMYNLKEDEKKISFTKYVLSDGTKTHDLDTYIRRKEFKNKLLSLVDNKEIEDQESDTEEESPRVETWSEWLWRIAPTACGGMN